MQGRVQAFVTEELGNISMDISKHELMDMLQRKRIRYKHTQRTVTLKNTDKTNMMYFIFSDSLDKIISVDLGCTELVAVVIDDKQYSPEYIRENLEWKHTMKCSYRGETVNLDENMNANCSTGLQCRMCSRAESVTHEAFLQKSIITYIDFGESTDNEMFCIENNDGKPVNYKQIQREDASYMKNKR